MANSGSPQPHDLVEVLVEVRAAGIRTDSRTDTPFLVLKDTSADRELLVAIGPSEATAIAFAQQQVAVPRAGNNGMSALNDHPPRAEATAVLTCSS